MTTRFGNALGVTALVVLLGGCDGAAPKKPESQAGAQPAPAAPGGDAAARNASGQPASPTPAPADYVAKVGDRYIDTETFEKELSRFPEQIKNTAPGRTYVVNQLIEQELLAIEAAQRGIEKSPEYQKKYEEFRRRTMKDLLLADVSKNQPPVDDAATKKYFDEHPGEFNRPMHVRARHIQFDANDTKNPVLVLAALKKGEDFAALAKKYSTDKGTADQGGNLGMFPKTRNTFISEVAFKMKAGEISKVVKSELGQHIVKVEEIQPAKNETYEQVKETLTWRLTAQRKAEAFNELIAELKKRNEIKINNDKIKGSEAPPVAPAAPAVPGKPPTDTATKDKTP